MEKVHPEDIKLFKWCLMLAELEENDTTNYDNKIVISLKYLRNVFQDLIASCSAFRSRDTLMFSLSKTLFPDFDSLSQLAWDDVYSTRLHVAVVFAATRVIENGGKFYDHVVMTMIVKEA